MIRKLLVANRGEIACRVISAAREMGIATVAVYSEADRGIPHTLLADKAVEIGPGEAKESYLDMSKILDVAKETGADAIHPGYGFLSERAAFSKACADAGVVFVGPSAASMELLGSKIEAKQLAVKVGMPVTPGYFEPGATFADIQAASDKIGFPVMLKASAGGGGRGMRAVFDAADLENQFHLAVTEAEAAFGDGAMMVEKLVQNPRHLEVQFLADGKGTVACLFERECSIQRRNQKLIEESSSPVMTEDLWQRMQAAVKALVAGAGYCGAGTAEFIFDEPTGEFYFMEVNARLQVEHPVTEFVSGVDLVQWQLKIASGLPLDLPEALLVGGRDWLRGHAIEARIVAEDPEMGFMPSIGKIVGWAEPKGPGIRVDTGYIEGCEVSRFYDSLLAKVIVHAETRTLAIQRLCAALRDFHILGVKTNIAYLLDVLEHTDFEQGHFDTKFLERKFEGWKPAEPNQAVLSGLLKTKPTAGPTSNGHVTSSYDHGAWQELAGFSTV